MQQHEITEKAKDPSIETIRAIAIILVFIHHLHSIAGITVPYIAPIGGWLGVQLFFLISGYLIIKSAVKYDATTFAKHRFFRIYPAYLFWFVFFLIITEKINLNSIDAKNLFFNLTMLQHFSPTAYYKYNTLPVSWTLSVELAWYIIAFIISKRFTKNPNLILFISIALSCIWMYGGVSYYPSYANLSDGDKYFFGSNNTIAQLPFFFFGAWIAIKNPTAEKTGLLSIVLSIIVLFPSWSTHFPNPIFITGLGVSAIFLILKGAKYKNPKSVLFLSDVSYSFYLIHYPIIVFASKITTNKYSTAIVALIATLAISYVSYILIERPFINLSKKVERPTGDENSTDPRPR